MITPLESDQYFDDCFAGCQLMVIMRGYRPDDAIALAARAWSLGITNIELTLQDSTGIDALRAVVEAGRETGRTVGAGTVTSRELVHEAAEAGAEFTVAPGTDPDVIEESLAAGLPHLPGIATPSEVGAVQRLGLGWVKAFPAAQLGPDWISALRGPFPRIRVVATGGIDASNAMTFLDSGVNAVALGSALSDPSQVERLKPLLPHGASAVGG
jgi:2-dehydro-3-deoxyphosphogluconate aldolase / (4S)-4-hydroxy-2-oxoglutarate aldolase